MSGKFKNEFSGKDENSSEKKGKFIIILGQFETLQNDINKFNIINNEKLPNETENLDSKINQKIYKKKQDIYLKFEKCNSNFEEFEEVFKSNQ